MGRCEHATSTKNKVLAHLSLILLKSGNRERDFGELCCPGQLSCSADLDTRFFVCKIKNSAKSIGLKA